MPFDVSCGMCSMCRQGLESQCQTTQNTKFHRGGSLFGYTEQYGPIPGCQADSIRVPFANHTAKPIHAETPAHRAVLLADVLPTAWQGVTYAEMEPGMCVAVFGLGPIGQMAARLATRQDASVIGVDPVDERRAMAERHGATTIDPDAIDDVSGAIVGLTDGQSWSSGNACTGDLIPLVEDPADPLDLDDFVTHRLPLESAPYAYDLFQHKRQGAVKVVFEPSPPVTITA